MDKIMYLLRQLDLSETEVKVYIALLKNGAMTGYEVSKRSSVPRSRIYSILESLVQKGFIICSKSDSPKHYSIIPKDELIYNKKSKYEDIMDELDEEISTYNTDLNADPIWNINGYENLFNKCRNMIKNCKKELFIQIWKKDVDKIYKEIKLVEQSDIKPLVILYSNDQDYEVDFKYMYKHGYEKEKLMDLGGRWVAIVSDSNEMVFGYIDEFNNTEAVSTQNSALVFLTKEYIKHDAYCLKLIDENIGNKPDDLKSKLQDIRNIYNT